jgi:predicted DNA-binding WGR domain protein
MYKEDLQEQIEGLKKKSEKSGIPYGILKTVYDRGMAAYKTGHRPGATAQQWAFARVNSFITKGKGTWGGADKDLAAKVKGSTKSEQAPCWDGYKQVGMKKKGDKMVPDCVKESSTDNDWVVVGKGRKVVRFLKNPKNNKAPRNWQKSSDEQEVMRVSKAKQMGIIKKESVEESLSGAENPPFKSKAGAGEFGTDKLEKTYRKDTPGQSEEVEEMDMKERANKPPKIKRNRGPYTQAQIQKASKHLSPMARTKLMGNLAQMTEELKLDIHLDEKIKCPSCDGKGCDHCGGSGYHKESDVEEAIRTKAAQRDELKRREKISTALKGKPQKKTFSSMRSRLAKEESEQVQEAVTVSRKDFDNMKKGDVVNVVFNSSMKKGHKVKLKVKSKTRSAKYDVDKINMVDASDPRNRTKFTFYSRQGKDATLAWGDMGTTLQSYKVESFDAVSEAHCSSSKKKITDEDVAQFIGAASAAKKDGKKEFKFGGKTYPVTISGDTAKKVLEDSFEESFDVSSLIESSDKTDAKEMSAMIKELEPKISPSKLKKEVEKMAMSKYKNKSRAKKISSFV